MSKETYLEEMLPAYIACMLWSSIDPETGSPLDENFGEDDLSPEALKECREDCMGFIDSIWSIIETLDGQMSAESCGHDFWLTRNGYGSGFWDRGYADPYGEDLSKAAKVYGGIDPMPGPDGLIYV